MAYFTQLDNGLWQDNKTGAIGRLKKGRGRGWYVDSEDQTPTTRRGIQVELAKEREKKLGKENEEIWKKTNKFDHNWYEESGKLTKEGEKLYNKREKNAEELRDISQYYREYPENYPNNWRDDRYNNPKEYTGDLGKVAGKHVERINTNDLDMRGLSDKESTDYVLGKAVEDKKEQAIDRLDRRYAKELQKEYDRISLESKTRQERAREIDKINQEIKDLDNQYRQGKTDSMYQLDRELLYEKKRELEQNMNTEKAREIDMVNQPAGEQTRQLIEEMNVKTFADEIKEEDSSQMSEWSDTVGDGYSDAQRKAYKDYLLETQGTTDEDLINAGREPENRVSIDKFANEQGKTVKSGNVTLPDGTPIDQNYVKDLYSGMSYEEVKRANDFDKEWMANVKPEAKAMQMAKVEETDKYLASMERYESRISDEEYGKKDWGDGVYPFSEGTAWKGTKSGERLSTKEIAKAVTDKMKEAYPGVKIGRNTSYYSGGSSADFYIASSDKPIVRDISDFSQTEISRLYNKGYNSNYYHTEDEFKASIEKQLTSGHFDINPYNIDDDYRLTPYGKQVVKDLRKVSDAYNYDESDGMTDYFNTGFYSDISIGRYNKPFVQGEQAKNNVKAKVDRYKERKGSSSNTMTKRQLAEKIVENQIERGVITDRNKEDIIKDKMRNFSKEDLLKYFK